MQTMIHRSAVVPIILAFSMLLLAPGTVRAAQSSVQATGKRLTVKMLGAITQRDFARFVQDGTPQFKAAMTKPQFEAVCDQIQPMMAKGYTVTYVSTAVIQGCDVTIWRLKFPKGQSLIAQIAVKAGKVAGFYLKPDMGQ